jgi:hypothetical protein
MNKKAWKDRRKEASERGAEIGKKAAVGALIIIVGEILELLKKDGGGGSSKR